MDVSGVLIRLMRNGPDRILRAILDHFEVSRVVNRKGSMLLHLSAISGNECVTSYLLERGCNPNAEDAAGMTPLMLAIQHKQDSVIQSLLEANADVDVVTRSGRNALQMAFDARDGLRAESMKIILESVRNGCSSREQLLDKLLKYGCQLYQAVILRDCKLTERMLDLDYPVDSKHPSYGYTALHIAASLIDLDNVRLLMRRGADVNAIDFDHQTPLFYLYNHSVHLNRDKLEILRLFLDSGVSLMTQTVRGFHQVGPGLSRACRRAIRRIFKSQRIDFSARDGFDGKTILHYLAMNMNRGVVEELRPYAQELHVNIVDKWGVSPLYFATEHGNVDMLEFLLSNGADPNIRHNTLDMTPLRFVVAQLQSNSNDRYDRCTELLLQHNADPQATFSLNKDDDAEPTMTIFDSAAFAVKTFSRVKLIIAHLAMLQCKGVIINERTLSKIQLVKIFEDYFESCRDFLGKNVFRNVTFLQLLTAEDKIVVRHLRDKNLLLRLVRMQYKYKARAHYPYYFNTLEKRVSKLLCRMRLEDNATDAICMIFQGQLCYGHLAVEQIFSYLDNESLFCLSEM